jgi:hypothetical protein
MRTPHKKTLWGDSVDTLEKGWEMLAKMREQETNCRRFDNAPRIRKHRATGLLDERHGLSALFCSRFLALCRRCVTNLQLEAGFSISALQRAFPLELGSLDPQT